MRILPNVTVSVIVKLIVFCLFFLVVSMIYLSENHVESALSKRYQQHGSGLKQGIESVSCGTPDKAAYALALNNLKMPFETARQTYSREMMASTRGVTLQAAPKALTVKCTVSFINELKLKAVEVQVPAGPVTFPEAYSVSRFGFSFDDNDLVMVKTPFNGEGLDADEAADKLIFQTDAAVYLGVTAIEDAWHARWRELEVADSYNK